MIGERIKLLRKVLNLSQRQFAENIHMQLHAVIRWENNVVTPNKTSLKNIETCYRINPLWLHEGKGPMFPAPDLENLLPETETVILFLKSLNKKQQRCFFKYLRTTNPDFQNWLTNRK